MKPLRFRGSSLEDIREMPDEAKNLLGNELMLVQFGYDPTDFKPISTVGAGVYEIRVRTDDGAFRVFYVAKFEEAIYVLHAFQKKTEQTAKADIDLGKRRYKELLNERKKL